MPILLTTPWARPLEPGESGPADTFPRAKVTQLTIDVQNAALHLKVEYGDVVDGGWVAHPYNIHLTEMVMDGDPETPFTDLMAQLTNDGENVYEACKRIAYEYLIANHPYLAGTIE